MSFAEVGVEVDPICFRSTEVELLIGDSNKVQKKLGWTPEYDLSVLLRIW